MAEREYTDEEYTAIGNEFLKLIAPAMQQQSQPAQQTSGQQVMPSRQAMPNQGRQVNLPKPKTLKKFPAGTATKVKQVLQNYRPQMPQQPQQMVPPQFMPMQAPQYAGAQMPNIYRNLSQQPQMQQGPFQAFNPYMVG